MACESRKTGVCRVAPRESFFGSFLVLLVVGVMTVGLLVPEAEAKYTLGTLSLLFAVALVDKNLAGIHLALFTILLFLPAHLGHPFRQWPLNILTPLLSYAFIVRIIPGLRNFDLWLQRGKADSKVIRLSLATTLLSVVALILWVQLTKPDLSHHIAGIPELPFWLYPFAAVGFAVSNAIMEEFAFRGIVMEALNRTLGPGYLSVLIQAIPFAALHYIAGFPNGLSGLLMLLIYGALLGAIKDYSKGLLAPVVVHVAADITIFSLLVCHSLSS